MNQRKATAPYQRPSYWFLISVCTLITVPTWSQTDTPPAQHSALDLLSSTKIACQQSYQLAPLRQTIQAKEANLTASERHDLWPKVSLKGGPTYAGGRPTSFFALKQVQDANAPDTRDKGGYWKGTVSMSLPLYDDGRWYTQSTPGEMKARAELGLSQAGLAASQWDIVTTVTDSYFRAAAQLQQLELLQEQVALRNAQQRAVERKVKLGLNDRIDLLTVRAEVQKLQEQYARTERSFDLNRGALALQLGSTQAIAIDKPQRFDQAPPTLNEDDLINQNLNNRPELMVQQAKLAQAQAELKKAKAGQRPSLHLKADSTIADDDLDTDEYRTFGSIGLEFEYQLGAQMENFKDVESKQHTVNAEQLQLDVLRRQLKYQLQADYYTYLNTIDAVTSNQAQLDQHKIEEQLAQEQYKKGLTGLDELVEKQQFSVASALQLIENKADMWRRYQQLTLNPSQLCGNPSVESMND